MVNKAGGRRRRKDRDIRRTLELPEAGPFILQGLGTLGEGDQPRQSGDSSAAVCQIHGPITAPSKTDQHVGSAGSPGSHVELGDQTSNGPTVSEITNELPNEDDTDSTVPPTAQRSKSIEDYVERLKTLSGRKKHREAGGGARVSQTDTLRHDTVRTTHKDVTLTTYSQSEQDLKEYTQRLIAVSSESVSRNKTKRSASLRYSPTTDKLARNGRQNGVHDSPSHKKCSSRQREGCCSRCAHSPRTWFALATFMATLTFLFSVNTDLLPSVNTLALENLLPLDHIHFQSDPIPTIFLIVLWGVHFLRRFTEVLFLHDYRRRVHPAEAIWLNVHYSGFGFWIGWSCSYFTRYRTPKNYILVPAGLVFLVGEVGNCLCHIRLRRMRHTIHNVTRISHTLTRHVFPAGGLFKHVACPHYLFEACSWVGFSLAVFTLPAFLFLGINLVSLVLYAWTRKRQYRTEFDGRDGSPYFDDDMKVLIPKVF